MSLKFNLLSVGDERFLTVYPEGGSPLTATSDSHHNFDELVSLVLADDESVLDLFDVQKAVSSAFEKVSDRVAVRSGVVYFDHEPVHNALADKIVNVLNSDKDAAKPLINFMEKVNLNSSENSKEQLYRFLEHHDLPITQDGDLILYKALDVGKDGKYYSIHAGHAIVDGVEYVDTNIPNHVGAVVEMPRSEVVDDPNSACNAGLHGGTRDYVNWFGGSTGVVMSIKVNPRDVVSVPHDWTSQKVRACRYEVLEISDKPYDAPVVYSQVEDYDPYAEGDDDEYDPAYEDNHAEQYEGSDVTFNDNVINALDGLNATLNNAMVNYSVGTLATKNSNSSSTTDTRYNYQNQKRGPGGRFVKSS